MKKLLVLIFLLAISGQAQEIEQMEVSSFIGGMVNGFANNVMQDNQAVVLENYDLTKPGYIRRRPGLTRYFKDSVTAPFWRLLPYYAADPTELYGIRALPNGGYDSLILEMVNCPDTACTDSIGGRIVTPYQYSPEPFYLATAQWYGRLFFSSSRSEFSYFDGDSVAPARPVAPGQPVVTAIDSIGVISGGIQYKYQYIDTTLATGSLFSPPSWTVYPRDGAVYVQMVDRVDTTTQDAFVIWCKHEDSTSWHLKDTTFTPNYTDTVGDSGLTVTPDLDYWDGNGDVDSCPCAATNNTLDITSNFEKVKAPDNFDIGFEWTVSYGPWYWPTLDFDSLHLSAHYAISYIDSAGRETYAGPVNCIETVFVAENIINQYSLKLSNLPTPHHANVVTKRIYRRLRFRLQADSPPKTTSAYDDYVYSWHELADIDAADTTFLDSALIDTIDGSSYTYVDPAIDSTANSLNLNPIDDSILTFSPTDLVEHGSRFYAIGDPSFKDRLYYSDFGRGTTWSGDFLSLPSDDGDWLVRLWSVSNQILYIFRQNSIAVLQGTNYFQYNSDDLIKGVGITARNSLAGIAQRIYFAHSSGIYEMAYGGQISNQPISRPIQATIDSAQIPYTVGRAVGNEYWASLALSGVTPERTYIYSTWPQPHWRSYSFGVKDAVAYNHLQGLDFTPGKWTMLLPNDSLYQWNIGTSDSDGTTPFIAKYRSKQFMDQGDMREKVFWVDFEGQGVCSLQVTIYDDSNLVVDIDTIYCDFTDNIKDRVIVNKIVSSFSIGWADFGYGDYELHGYVVGYKRWDGGKL